MAKVKSNSVLTFVETKAGYDVTVLGAGSFGFDVERCSDVNRGRAEMHGWKQRLADAAAIPCDKDTGKPASPKMKYDAVRQLAEFYMTGTEDWRQVVAREGGGASGAGKLLLMALQEAYPQRAVEQLKEFLKGKSAAEKFALMQNAKLKPIIDRLTAELVGEVDMDAELEAFDSQDGDEEAEEEVNF